MLTKRVLGFCVKWVSLILFVSGIVLIAARVRHNYKYEGAVGFQVGYSWSTPTVIEDLLTSLRCERFSDVLTRANSPILLMNPRRYGDPSPVSTAMIVQWSTQWKIMDLSDTNVDDDAVVALAKCKKLMTLNLARTHVTDKCVQVLTSLPEIHSIDLTGTGLSDQGLRKLSQIRSLRRLTVDFTSITETGVMHVSNSSVRTFSIVGCCGIDPKKEVFANFRELYNIVLDDRIGSAAIVEVLKANNPEVKIELVHLYPADAMEPEGFRVEPSEDGF